jgi:hypothetical protein
MQKEQGSSSCYTAAESTETHSDGAAVIQEIVQMTGLPEDYLDSEISQLLGTPGESVNHLTLDQLRSVLLNYLETVNEEMTQGQERH